MDTQVRPAAFSTSRALRQWRRIAAMARPRTELWFEAKLQVAQLLVSGGQPGEARKLLEFIRAVPPGWNNSPLAGQFEQLLNGLPRDPGN